MLAAQDSVRSNPPVGTAAINSPTPLDAGVEGGSVQRQRSLARAARHEILRRIAPALKHDMVVPLQSLGMMAEAVNARLERGKYEADELQSAISKLNRLSRQAVEHCLHVASWLEGTEDDTVALRDGIDECVELLRSSLNFRGFALRSEVGDSMLDVGRVAVRFLLPAAILTLTDSATAPGEVVVTAETSSTHAVLQVTHRPDDGEPLVHESGEVPLSWVEVQALAAAESVEIRRNGPVVVMRLPRAVVTAPLKMVPV